MATSTALGRRLKQARKLAGLTCRGLDRASGLTEGHCNLIENGERKHPSGTTVVALAKALGITSEWLLDGTGAPPVATSGEAKGAA
jgi:transcriptional regulator with XRE-family HTH domain